MKTIVTGKTTKSATKSEDPKETVKVQFGGEKFVFANIKKAVETDYSRQKNTI